MFYVAWIYGLTVVACYFAAKRLPSVAAAILGALASPVAFVSGAIVIDAMMGGDANQILASGLPHAVIAFLLAPFVAIGYKRKIRREATSA